MTRKIHIPGERKLWVAYLLWPTLVGHRWYLAKLSPIYTLTMGYFGLMWLADLFRIPKMVREYNSFVYQRSVARAMHRNGDRSFHTHKRFYSKVAGTSFHQDALKRCKEGEPLRLVREPENPYDRNAIAVYSQSNELIGHIKRDLAAELAPLMDSGVPIDVRISELTGGTEDKPAVGCNILVQYDSASSSAGDAASFPAESEGARKGILGGAIFDRLLPKGLNLKMNRRAIVLLIVGGVIILVLLISLFSTSGGGEGTTEDQAVSRAVTAEKALTVTLTTPSGLTVNDPTIALEGVTEPNASVTVTGCANAPVLVQAGEDGRFSVPIVLNEGGNLLTIAAEREGLKGSASCSITYQLDEAAYKAQCQPIEFRVLNKNPDAYKGQKYFTMGEVVQIMEGLGGTDIRLNVTKDQWGFWDDTIYVTYSGTVPAYEKSIIKVWGEVKGSYTYTSVAGWKITLPLVQARFIEVVKP
ncbi:MAG: HIRAN domain-containing protein [Actinomycetota bacterium]